MHDFLEEDAYYQSLREPWLKFYGYLQHVDDHLETFEKVGARLQQPPEKIAEAGPYGMMSATNVLATDATKHLTLLYSAGHDIADMAAFYARAMEYWQTYAHYNKAYNDSDRRSMQWPHVVLPGQDYHLALAMVCFGILLGKQKVLQRFLPLLDYLNDSRDALVERLLSCCFEGRQPEVNICRRNLPYSKSLAIFAAQPKDRPAAMARYLKNWYDASRKETWHDKHEEGYDFFGYWSWEAAALTLVLDIDDTEYRDLPYYPAAMVDFARHANAGKMPAYVAPAIVESADMPQPEAIDELATFWQHKQFSPADFDEKRRAGRMRYESYEYNIEYLTEKVLYESTDPDDFDGASLLATEAVNHLRNCYSAGHALEDLHAFYPLAVQCWENYGRHLTPYLGPGEDDEGTGADEDYYDLIWLDLAGDDYHTALTMVCFAILLGHQDKLASIMTVIDSGGRRDALLERLVAPWVSGRDAPPRKCTRGKPYSQTLPIFSAPPAQRAALMTDYLQAWYDMSEDEPYYGSNRKGMRHLGYWSFEAAAISLLLDIDDAGYRDDRFFPRELLDFARSQSAGRQQDVT